ncbi:hypothetical protein EJ08DRAFT_733844 [Tothia fuscella]|uniref:Uncharacterized protein n=1 Tax=Tothia fuscella TaxID=1048955 RepID=A0A9P4NSV4_9PEZI|nr:hypothetical protein EJ08DRAFT_733844 [Tothia fuscella]
MPNPRGKRRGFRKKPAKPKPPRASFETLPSELLLRIAEEFDPIQFMGSNDAPEGFCDVNEDGVEYYSQVLRSFCLASKTFFPIGKSILDTFWWEDRMKKERESLIRKFIANPAAAASIRAVSVTSNDETRDPCFRNVIEKDEIGKDLLSAAAKWVSMDSKSIWLQMLKTREEDSLLVLLLSLLPNLEIICFRVFLSLHAEYPWTLAYLRSNARQYLSMKIRNVISYFENDAGIASLLNLPSLRSIVLSQAWGRSRNEAHQGGLTSSAPLRWTSPITWPRRASNVERLVLEECDVDPYFLANIITACKGLKYFKYSWAEHGGDTAALDGLVRSLETQMETLETLILDPAQSEGFGPMLTEPLAPLGSLKNFSKLRHVEMSAHIILGNPGYDGYSYYRNAEVWLARVFYRSAGASPASRNKGMGTVAAQLSIKPVGPLEYDHDPEPHFPDYATIADMFPPSLETLIVSDQGEGPVYFLPFLIRLAEKLSALGYDTPKPNPLPNLREIDISQRCYPPRKPDCVLALWFKLANSFSNVGVELVLPLGIRSRYMEYLYKSSEEDDSYDEEDDAEYGGDGANSDGVDDDEDPYRDKI